MKNKSDRKNVNVKELLRVLIFGPTIKEINGAKLAVWIAEGYLFH